MTTADLSVVIPNYNHARFLPRALDAILSQIVAAREVIVLDDSSADDSVAVVEGYARKYPAVRLVRNERNLGVVATINRGIGLAAGTYLLLAGADDYVLPGFFEKALGLLAAHPHAGLACGLDSCQSGEGGRIDPNPGNGWGRAGYFTPDEVCDRLRHTIGGHAAVYRRDALAQQGGFKPELRWYSDWFALLTCAFRHGACHLPEMLAVRMIAPQNYSADAKPGGGNVAVLGAFLDLVTGPAFADVAPFFRRNGAASFFGPDLVRAAARRADCWSPPVLGFLNGFTPEQYAELLADPDATVRELAAFFLGPFWKQRAAEQADRAAELAHLRAELDAARRGLPPPGAAGKLRWVAGMAARRLRRAVRLGPARSG